METSVVEPTHLLHSLLRLPSSWTSLCHPFALPLPSLSTALTFVIGVIVVVRFDPVRFVDWRLAATRIPTYYFVWFSLFFLLFHPCCHAVCAPWIPQHPSLTTTPYLDTRHLLPFRTHNHFRSLPPSFFHPSLWSYLPSCVLFRPLGLVWSATSTGVLCTTRKIISSLKQPHSDHELFCPK